MPIGRGFTTKGDVPCAVAHSSENTSSLTRNEAGSGARDSCMREIVASVILGNPGKAFGGNWSVFVFSISMPLAAWVATKYFVPFYRNTGETVGRPDSRGVEVV